MTAKQRAAEITALLKREYEVAECSLDYADAWQLLVAVRLAAQCTDARVNIVTERLFARYGSPEQLAAAPVEAIEAIVRPCGLGATKARDIKKTMGIISERYGGLVPDTMDGLLALPGVGRKSANLIIGDIYKRPAVVTDTHCIRLCNRFGLVNTTLPAAVEKRLWELLDPTESNDFCHRLVLHGRAVCKAQKPECGACCLSAVCQKRIDKRGTKE